MTLRAQGERHSRQVVVALTLDAWSAKADGIVMRSERRELQLMLDRASRRIRNA